MAVVSNASRKGWRYCSVITTFSVGLSKLGRLVNDHRVLTCGAALLVMAVVVAVAMTARDGGEVATVDTSGPPRVTATIPTSRPEMIEVTTAPPTTAQVSNAPPATPSPTAPPPPVAGDLQVAPPTPAPVVGGPTRPGGLTAFTGLGAWLDVWDWSPSYTAGNAPVDLGDIDRMRALGVRTVYIQTSRYDRPEDVIDVAILHDIITRAHGHGMYVVGWYLPTFQDVNTDLRRLVEAAALPVDAIGVDVESRLVADHSTRSQRLLDLSSRLNHAVSHVPIAAITLPPVVTEIINPAYWPGHPWNAMAAYYDVWMPMGYWGNRTPESGWRDGYRYTAENIDLIRRLTGDPGAAVHPVGGVGSDITAAEINGMVAAARDRHALGGSIYDYATTYDALWPSLQGFTAF